MTAHLPCGPPVNTDIYYCRTFFETFFTFVSVAKLVVRYLLGWEKAVFAL